MVLPHTTAASMGEFPEVLLRDRVGGEFVDVNTHELFANKRIVIFGLPGAFTPTCSTKQLPGFEKLYHDFRNHGIDEVYCHSVNDSFVMKAWFESLGIQYVKPLADGSGHLSAMLNTLVTKVNCGFGLRTWRYAGIVDNLQIEIWREEDGKKDEHPEDPFEVSGAEDLLKYVKDKFLR